MTQREQRMGFWQVVGSVLAALVGVQSEKNRQRDFTSGSPFAFIAIGTVATLILILLIAAAAYTFLRPDLGTVHRPQHSGRREFAYALVLGGAIGFYDGFFGPGTGSFLIFLFIRFFGFDFLHASAAAKVVNMTTNLAALGYFIPSGHLLPQVAVVMACANVLGSLLGTHLALRHGSRFVRIVFLCVVSAFIVKFAHDTFA